MHGAAHVAGACLVGLFVVSMMGAPWLDLALKLLGSNLNAPAGRAFRSLWPSLGCPAPCTLVPTPGSPGTARSARNRDEGVVQSRFREAGVNPHRV